MADKGKWNKTGQKQFEDAADRSMKKVVKDTLAAADKICASEIESDGSNPKMEGREQIAGHEGLLETTSKKPPTKGKK